MYFGFIFLDSVLLYTLYKTAELGIKLAFNSFKLAIVSHNILWFGPPSREHINWND